MIELKTGDADVRSYTAPASTTFAFNDVVTRDSSGQLALATALTPRAELLGIIQTVITSADSDYTSTKTVPVLLFDEDVDFEADVDTGTLTTSMVGLRYDLNDQNGIDVTSQGQKAVEITRFISSSKARVKFITDGDKFEMKSYQQTVSVSEFTDGGGAVGTLSLGTTLPAGAVVARTLVTGVVGFAGNVSATLQVGDGTTVDRYSTGTPSVFATASAGVSMGAVSGTPFHSTAKTPVLTVTSSTDFTAVVTDGNGALTVTIFYYVAS